jgi:hypothetical protein
MNGSESSTHPIVEQSEYFLGALEGLLPGPGRQSSTFDSTLSNELNFHL